MKNLRNQEEIMATWKGEPDKPVVSICCITYNHESYIEDALEGFLIQETDFPFEILIHDDASTDRTTEIIRQYEAHYPNLIKPIYQTDNQYSKGKKINAEFNYKRAKGKYVSLCEGDDYWRDEHKLSIQKNFLENNEQYSIVYHDAIVIDGSGRKVHENKLSKNNRKDASEYELKTSFKISTQAVMVRYAVVKECYENIDPLLFGGDMFIKAIAGCFGKGKYISNIKPSAFRIHSGGINRGVLDESLKQQNYLRTRICLYKYFYLQKDIEVSTYYLRQIALTSLRSCIYKNNVFSRLVGKFSLLLLYINKII
ncbi:glycosyl transferase family 2 [Methylophaga nitratireducenticrescens]|uniref:Glycosyl transferase n=1 Tax=Methylophaga nitratireducenticrescens TaxID=754476 RepID=I1XHR4_METNJ|nr:glycosyltransferase [Methylophaga nitratireducenticrescens]AFI83933.1 glycosyl transferase family 2 [Methylophaga nitratireducenticrescens]